MNLDDLAAQAATLTPAASDAAGATSAPGAAAAPVAAPPTPAEANTLTLCAVFAILRDLSAMPLILDPPLATPKRMLTDDQLPPMLAPLGETLAYYNVELGTIGDLVNHPLGRVATITLPALWAFITALREELAARLAKPIKPEPDDDSEARRPG